MEVGNNSGYTHSIMKTVLKLLLFLLFFSTIALADSQTKSAANTSNSFLDLLTRAGHTKFVTFIQETGLESYFKEPSGTYLIPSNAYFSGLSGDEYKQLKSDKAEIVSALRSQTSSQLLLSSQLTDGKEFESLEGDILEVYVEEDEVMIGSLSLVSADLRGNGFVIHIVDEFQIDLGDQFEEMDEGS